MLGPLCVHGRDIRPSFNQYYKGRLNRCNAYRDGFLRPQSTGPILSEHCVGSVLGGLWSQADANDGVVIRREIHTRRGCGPRGIPSP